MGVREEEAAIRAAVAKGKLKYKVVDTGADRAARPAGSVARYHVVDSEGRFAGAATNKEYADELVTRLQAGKDRPAHLSPGGNQVALVEHYKSQISAPAAAAEPRTLGQLKVVKQANGKFIIMDEAGGVLHSKAGKTSTGRPLPAAPMEFNSRTVAAEIIVQTKDKFKRNSRYNPSFVKIEVAPAANAAGELPVTFDPKSTEGKKVKFLADEAYDKGYRVIDRGPDVPAAERYTFKNPAGVESTRTFPTQQLAQDDMVKRRATVTELGRPPKFEGVDYQPPKPEPVKAEPVKVEKVTPVAKDTAKPKASAPVPRLTDGPSGGVGFEAVLKEGGKTVELRVDGKVVGNSTFRGDPYFVTDGDRWNRVTDLEAAQKGVAGSGKFKVVDVHRADASGGWSRLGAAAAEPDLGHPVYDPQKPAPAPVTPESVVEDAVNKGKAARGEATIPPATEGTAMPKNPKPAGQGLKVIDRGAKGWQPGRRFVVQDNAGNILFEGKKADAAAALERMQKVPADVLQRTSKLNTSMRGLGGVPVETGSVGVGSVETAGRQALLAQQAASQAAGAGLQQADDLSTFLRGMNVNLNAGGQTANTAALAGLQQADDLSNFLRGLNVDPAAARQQLINQATGVVTPGASSPVSFPAQGVSFTNGGLTRIAGLQPVIQAPSAAAPPPSAAAPPTGTTVPPAVGTNFVRPAGGTGFVRAAGPSSPLPPAAPAGKFGSPLFKVDASGQLVKNPSFVPPAAQAADDAINAALRPFATKRSGELSRLGKTQQFFAKAPITSAIPRMTAGLPSGLKWAPKTGLGGLGVGLGANILGSVAGQMVDESNLFGGADSRANDAVAAAIRGAGMGAGIGMAIPGIGVPLGALGGAAIGGLWNYFGNDGGGGQQRNLGTLEELAALQQKYGIDMDTMAQIRDDYRLRMDMAETDDERAAARTAARTSFQNAALEANQRFDSSGIEDALAMQAMIGNYIKPYADMYAGMENEVALAYDRAAKAMGGSSDMARLAQVGAAQARSNAQLGAGTMMGAAMVDPMIATQQKQAGQLAQIEQQLYAQQMAGMLGTGGTAGSNLLGGG